MILYSYFLRQNFYSLLFKPQSRKIPLKIIYTHMYVCVYKVYGTTLFHFGSSRQRALLCAPFPHLQNLYLLVSLSHQSSSSMKAAAELYCPMKYSSGIRGEGQILVACLFLGQGFFSPLPSPYPHLTLGNMPKNTEVKMMGWLLYEFTSMSSNH